MTEGPYDRDTVVGMYRLRIALGNLEDAIYMIKGDVSETDRKFLLRSLYAMQGRRLKMCQGIGRKHGDATLECESRVREIDRQAYEDGQLYRAIGETYGYQDADHIIEMHNRDKEPIDG